MKNKNDGNQQGAQSHAEGQHGDKTYAAILQGSQQKHPDTDDASAAGQPSNDANVYGQTTPGHHRLEEHREQHDRAEQGSEATRNRG